MLHYVVTVSTLTLYGEVFYCSRLLVTQTWTEESIVSRRCFEIFASGVVSNVLTWWTLIFVWWWQVIVNMSRIQWRGLALNLPIKLKDFNKMLSINAAVREMLHSHPKIYLENENPHCNVSQVGPASFELAITCDLKPMVTHCQLGIPFFKAPQTMQ